MCVCVRVSVCVRGMFVTVALEHLTGIEHKTNKIVHMYVYIYIVRMYIYVCDVKALILNLQEVLSL